MNITSVKPDSISDNPRLLTMKKLVAKQIRLTEMASRNEITNDVQNKALKDLEIQKTELQKELSKKEIEEVKYLGTELFLKTAY